MTGSGASPQLGNGASGSSTSWLAELRMLTILASPICLQQTAQQAFVLSSQAFFGTLGAQALAGAAVGLTEFNLIWYYILGLATSLDTHASQAFGNGDRARVAAWCITATGCMTILCVPLGILLLLGGPIASILFRQPEAIVRLVQTYCNWSTGTLLPYVWCTVLMKGMQAQNSVWGPAICTLAAAVLNIPLTALLTRQYGFWGAACANGMSRVLQLALLLGYLLCWGRGTFSLQKPAPNVYAQDSDHIRSPLLQQQTEHVEACADSVAAYSPHDGQAMPGARAHADHATLAEVFQEACSLKAVSAFLRLALPGGIMMAADSGSFDITTAMAASLGTSQVDAHTTVMTIVSATYMSVPFGIGSAATIRVGNLLGAGSGAQARMAGWLSILVCVGFMLLWGVTFYSLRHVIGALFVRDAAVAQRVDHLAYIIVGYLAFDGLFAGSSGALRGLGYQMPLMIFCLIAFWGCGVSLGAVLTFRVGLGLPGLWLGITGGTFTAGLLCSLLFVWTSWDDAAAKILSEKMVSGKVICTDHEEGSCRESSP